MKLAPRTWAAAAALALVAGLAVTARVLHPPPALPVLGRIPDFALVDQRGAPYATGAMLGRATVADFVFTRCPSSCPRLTARMARLQGQLVADGSQARLVSFSVDPDFDTPAVLAAYAAKVGADPARWTFVTGPADDVIRVVVQGFKMSAAKVAKGASDYDVTHGDWFVLVDRAGQIRGYYPTEEPADVARLTADAERLDRERP